jgi:hypothetical protein
VIDRHSFRSGPVQVQYQEGLLIVDLIFKNTVY